MKNLGLWFVILLGLVVVVNVMQGPSRSGGAGSAMAYSDFLTKVDEGAIKSVEIRGAEIIGKTSCGRRFPHLQPRRHRADPRLRGKNVRFDAKPEESRSLLAQLFFNMLPFVLMIGIWIFVMRQMQNGAGTGAMGFGKIARQAARRQGRPRDLR